MSVNNYKITIKNESGDGRTGRVYSLYVDVPTFNGGGVASTFQLQWSKTRPLTNGAQAAFNYTSELFGFVGFCSTPSSSDIQDGTTISLERSVPAKVSPDRSTGSTLEVKEKDSTLSITDLNKDYSAKGTFKISLDGQISEDNNYVVGLARKSTQTDIAPVAAVPARTNADYIVTPKFGVYVARSDKGDGTVITPPKPSVMVEFKGATKEAVVSETKDGLFSLVYK